MNFNTTWLSFEQPVVLHCWGSAMELRNLTLSNNFITFGLAQKKQTNKQKQNTKAGVLRLFGSSSDEVEKMLLRPFFLSSNNRQYTFFYV